MINFKEELTKYKPILEIDSIEKNIYSNELQDMFDVLQHISKQNTHDFSDGLASLDDNKYINKE